MNPNGSTTGAMYVSGTRGTNGYGNNVIALRNAILDASRASAVYGRNNSTEIRPRNYAIQYFIKY